MGKQAYRYKVTGVVKFSVDDIVMGSVQQVKEYINDDPGGNVEFAKKNNNTEILELNVEALEPCDEEKFEKTGKC